MLDQARTGTAHVAPGWGQGRATYGGLVAGLMLSALKAQLPSDGTDAGADEGGLLPLRSMTVSFVGPLEPGEAELQPRILRAGRSAVQGEVLVVQDGDVEAAMLASFGRPRASQVVVDPDAQRSDLTPPEEVSVIPFIEGTSPGFLAHVDLRTADGGWPYSSAGTSHLKGYMRFREAPPVFGEEHFVSLLDAWPPAVIQMLDQPRPASSMTWTLELLDDVAAAPDTFWQYEVRTDQARDGYAHTEAHVWHPDGRLVAISRQTIAVFG